MDKNRLGSVVRRSLIALLTVSAVLLAAQTVRFGVTQGTGGIGEVRQTALPEEQTGRESAVLPAPRAIVVFRADGERLAVAYDGARSAAAFGPLAALLGETLGSAGAAEPMTGLEFRSCLGEEGVFLDLGVSYPLELLARWLGAGAPGSALGEADKLCLLPGGEQVEFCYRSGSGGFFRCVSAARSEALRRSIADFSGERASFAFQEGIWAGVDPYLVLPETMQPPSAVRLTLPGFPGAEQVMQTFRMNSYVAASYQETDGTVVYTEDAQTLRLAPDGSIRYRGGTDAPEAADSCSAAELSLAIARQVLNPVCGAAELCFAKLEGDDGNWTVRLNYAVGGIPVRLSAGDAAELRFQDGRLRSAVLRCRCFDREDETVTLLPLRFAAAIAAAEGEGSPVLVYQETAEGLRCLWVND